MSLFLAVLYSLASATYKTKPFLCFVNYSLIHSLTLLIITLTYASLLSLTGVAGACESIPVILQAHPTSEYVASAGCDVISFMSEVSTNGFAARFGQAGTFLYGMLLSVAWLIFTLCCVNGFWMCENVYTYLIYFRY